jgi:hypothetical protein
MTNIGKGITGIGERPSITTGEYMPCRYVDPDIFFPQQEMTRRYRGRHGEPTEAAKLAKAVCV